MIAKIHDYKFLDVGGGILPFISNRLPDANCTLGTLEVLETSKILFIFS